MSQYITLAKRIVEKGTWIENERTKKNCKVIINHDLEYNVGNKEFPLDTTRKSYWKAAIAEMIGYLRGYDNAADFRSIGCKTWDANANKNEAWLNNPNRKGLDDMGNVYGVQARRWRKPDGSAVDQLKQVVDDLTQGIDNRGEIVTFYNPGEFDLGCLRPCMHSHHFSLVNGTLYLNSTQRSCDVPLGLSFNQVQVYFLLAIMAQITGNKAGVAYHKIVNAHIYEDQYDLMANVQIHREPFEAPTFHINPEIKTLEDLETWVTLDDFEVKNYKHHEAISYPFSV